MTKTICQTDSEIETESETETMGSSHLTDMPRPTTGGFQPVLQLEGCHYRSTGHQVRDRPSRMVITKGVQILDFMASLTVRRIIRRKLARRKDILPRCYCPLKFCGPPFWPLHDGQDEATLPQSDGQSDGPSKSWRSIILAVTRWPEKGVNALILMGRLTKLRNEELRNMLLDEENLSEKQIEGLVNLFIDNVKNGTWKSKGWPILWTDYAVSKLALNAYSKVLARNYKGKGISVNCYCPGFTQTSMTGGKGKYTAQVAADIGVKLALLPPEHLPTGKFYLGSNPPSIYSKI
ncbi:putative ribonuclease H protein-like [Capsicum annuum]|nr:putative ribonuclease H protein-like [Capsicum annuum]